MCWNIDHFHDYNITATEELLRKISTVQDMSYYFDLVVINVLQRQKLQKENLNCNISAVYSRIQLPHHKILSSNLVYTWTYLTRVFLSTKHCIRLDSPWGESKTQPENISPSKLVISYMSLTVASETVNYASPSCSDSLRRFQQTCVCACQELIFSTWCWSNMCYKKLYDIKVKYVAYKSRYFWLKPIDV